MTGEKAVDAASYASFVGYKLVDCVKIDWEDLFLKGTPTTKRRRVVCECCQSVDIKTPQDIDGAVAHSGA